MAQMYGWLLPAVPNPIQLLDQIAPPDPHAEVQGGRRQLTTRCPGRCSLVALTADIVNQKSLGVGDDAPGSADRERTVEGGGLGRPAGAARTL